MLLLHKPYLNWFDINNANGIVKVSAKDLGTGKSQDITITASSNLSEDDINKAVNDAKKYEEEDKKRKEVIDIHNQLDGLIFSIEKTVKDSGDKLTDEDKAKLEDAVKEAKVELETNDKDKMKAAMEKLSNDVQPIFTKLYQQAQAEQGANNGAPNGDGDTEFHQN